MADGGKMGWMEYLRFVTPLGILVLSFYSTMTFNSIDAVKKDLKEVSTEVLHHLTNSDIHIPRLTVVSRDEFLIYQSMRDKQMDQIKDSMTRIEAGLERHREESERSYERKNSGPDRTV